MKKILITVTSVFFLQVSIFAKAYDEGLFKEISQKTQDIINSSLEKTSIAEFIDKKNDIKIDLSKLQAIFGDKVNIYQIKKTEIDGIYSLILSGKNYYISEDGRYLFTGDLIDLKQKINISENTRKEFRKNIMKEFNTDDFIIFPVKNKKRTVIVFTDINCSYCIKVYNDISKYNNDGIEIQLAPFPRFGYTKNSYKVINAVWCAEDRYEALENAQKNKYIEHFCDEFFINQIYNKALEIGINTTPSYLLDDGTLIQGYISPLQLLNVLDKNNLRKNYKFHSVPNHLSPLPNQKNINK